MRQLIVCPVYVAPEVLDMRAGSGAVYSGRPADIWALGILMFILLTGRYPFCDRVPSVLFKRIKSGRFTFMLSEHLSREGDDLIHLLAIFMICFQLNGSSMAFFVRIRRIGPRPPLSFARIGCRASTAILLPLASPHPINVHIHL